MFSMNTAGIFCFLICAMILAMSLADGSASVETPSGEMNSMP